MNRVFAAVLLATGSVVRAAPLTVPTGESWIFTLKGGQPAEAHQVAATDKPSKGEIMVSVRALFGTSMIVTNNSSVSYIFKAELLSGGKAIATRPCTLPKGAQPILEQWPQKADAVRIGNFRATGPGGRC